MIIAGPLTNAIAGRVGDLRRAGGGRRAAGVPARPGRRRGTARDRRSARERLTPAWTLERLVEASSRRSARLRACDPSSSRARPARMRVDPALYPDTGRAYTVVSRARPGRSSLDQRTHSPRARGGRGRRRDLRRPLEPLRAGPFSATASGSPTTSSTPRSSSVPWARVGTSAALPRRLCRPLSSWTRPARTSCFSRMGAGRRGRDHQDRGHGPPRADARVGRLDPGAQGGIMEIPDVIAVNKRDHPAAKTMVNEVRSILALGEDEGWQPPIVLTEAVKARASISSGRRSPSTEASGGERATLRTACEPRG